MISISGSGIGVRGKIQAPPSVGVVGKAHVRRHLRRYKCADWASSKKTNLFVVRVDLGEVAFAQVPDLLLLLFVHHLPPVFEEVLVEHLRREDIQDFESSQSTKKTSIQPRFSYGEAIL